MTTIIISKSWYEEIKTLIVTENAYFFTECGSDKVEVDVEEEEFNRVSKELGWIE